MSLTVLLKYQIITITIITFIFTSTTLYSYAPLIYFLIWIFLEIIFLVYLYSFFTTNIQNIEEYKQNVKKALDTKGEFLSNMSHEIRTPMNGVIGMSHLLLQTDLDTKQKNYLYKIDNSAKNLLLIINDILDFSKIENEKLTVEKIDFDIFNLINDVINITEIKAEQKNLKLKVHYSNDIKQYLKGDSFRISQVLINLVLNAIKYTNNGTISINITTKGKDEYRFEVKDNGIGISKKSKKNLFKPFSQANGNSTRMYGGTGLELTISKQLVVLMDGKIWVESEKDIGSSFFFELELPESQNIDGFTMGAVCTLNRDINTLIGSKILLVEDNLINQEIIIGLLKESGIEIDIANNGQEAVDKFKKNVYELILMDLQMPIMNGFEASKQIKAINKNIPIIALTANIMKEDKQRTKSIGISEHLEKPIDVNILYRTLLLYISQKSAIISSKQEDKKLEFTISSLTTIDIDVGLKHMAGNKKLYLQILKDFHYTYSDIYFESLNIKEFKRSVHTLKSLSASIGAKSLCIIVQELDDTGDRTLLPDMYDALNKVLEEIELISIDETKTKNTQKEITEEQKKRVFDELTKAIKTKQPKKYKLILQEIEEYRLEREDREQFIKIKEFLSKYKFAKALKLIEGM